MDRIVAVSALLTISSSAVAHPSNIVGHVHWAEQAMLVLGVVVSAIIVVRRSVRSRR